MRQKKKSIVVLIGFIFLFSALVFSEDNPNISDLRREQKNPNTSQLEYSNEALTAYQNFTVLEIAENNGTMENVGSIDIDLDTSRWNVTDIEFNITDIDFENETKTIEDKVIVGSFNKIDKFEYNGLGVQIEILASTIIYGANIYGENLTTALSSEATFFQLQGFDKATGNPNGTILRSIPLNMSKSKGEGWHLQNFLTPITLPKGSYYLVINGTNIGQTPDNVYRWFFCGDNPYYPYLNISKFEKPPFPTWTGTEPGRPFLYKLIQKVDESIYPEQINMTAEMNGTDHHINDGNVVSTGNLSLSFDNYFPNTTILNIPVKNNVSDALIFNLSYYIKLNNSLSVRGSVLVREGLDNLWTLEPNLNRLGYNYSIRYEYSNHWKYVSVWKDDINITGQSDVLKKGNSITILNDTITQGAEWKITANSTRINPTINPGGKISYTVGEELKFFVESLPNVGNYTFVLIDSIGDVAYSKLVEKDNTANFEYNYTLLSNSRSGDWLAFVFWNNETDAGIQTQAFQITGASGSGTTVLGGDNDDGSDSTTATDYFIVLVVIIVIGIVGASSFASYTAYKRVMKTRERQRETLHDKFTDILSLNHVIVIDKKSGLNVFEQFFGGKSMDATLISGFLDAIRSFGLELTGSYRQTQTIALEYQNSKVLMSEFKSFRLILIMAERPSQEFLNSIDSLSYDIDENFGEQLKNFAGNVREFEDIKDLISKHLNTAFISPLKVLIPPDVKLKPAEKSMINKAKQLMKQNNLTYFYSTFLMSDQAFNPRDTEIIFNLIDKKIFQPMDITLS